MEIDVEDMQCARRLNGTMINGYGGYFTHHSKAKDNYLVIVIPHSQEAVDELMAEIDCGV